MKYADELNKVITAETVPTASPETETETLQGAQTCHQWCWRLLGRMGPWRPAGGPSYRYRGLQRPVVDDNRRKAAILHAIGRVRERAGRISTRVLDNPFEWWLDEFRWIKGALLSEETVLPEGIVLPKGRLIKTFADYKGAARTGRGSALQAGPRQLVWDVFSAYQEFLKTAHTVTRDTKPPHPPDEIDFDDYARRIVEYCCAASGVTSCLEMSVPRECEGSRVDHVLIDESQDLTQVQLLLLSKLARKTVTLVADM